MKINTVSNHINFPAVFLQSFSAVVPIPSYSSPLTSSIFSLSSQKIFAETQTEEKWHEGLFPYFAGER